MFQIPDPKEQLVAIMKRIYAQGMTTTSGGNLSIKDENGNVYITPGGTDKGSMTAEDIRLYPCGWNHGGKTQTVQ